MPRHIVVSIEPYETIDEAIADIAIVDWDRDTTRARAVTMAYAARELQRHLQLAGIETQIHATNNWRSPSRILLALHEDRDIRRFAPNEHPINYTSLGTQGYAIVPERGQVLVTANTRIGLLYGIYGLLEQFGFAWYDPYETHLPDKEDLTGLRRWSLVQHVPLVLRRGFWIFGPQTTPDEFAIWLARNRFNLGGRPRFPLQRLLGIKSWDGGHELLQEEFSLPGLFETHPDWYAEINGVRRPVAPTGTYFNPSFANVEAANYFADRMILRLESGNLLGVDILNLWPTDDRFNKFDQSAAAVALGNETDNLLFFYANVCKRLREAQFDGRLSRPVTLAGISYFLTMRPPTNQTTIERLRGEDYLHIFYPIDRDWNGRFDVSLLDRDSNRRILQDMQAWGEMTAFESGVVEYHNQSIYGGVAVTDHIHLTENYHILVPGHNGLYAYMHPLLKNPGPRRLTNLLQAKLAWRNPFDTSEEASVVQSDITIRQYFSQRYGVHAEDWRTICDLMARSTENSKEMFWINSLSWLLLQEQIWGSRFYSEADTVALIDKYRIGGVQELPAAFSGLVLERAAFRGLNESLALQAQAHALWEVLLASSLSSTMRAHMESDVVWFEATASRYRLLSATVDFVVARYEGKDVAVAKANMEKEIELLSNTTVTEDTISPVDQRAFLSYYRLLAQ